MVSLVVWWYIGRSDYLYIEVTAKPLAMGHNTMVHFYWKHKCLPYRHCYWYNHYQHYKYWLVKPDPLVIWVIALCWC